MPGGSCRPMKSGSRTDRNCWKSCASWGCSTARPEAGAIKAVRKNPAIEGLTSHLAKLPRDKWKYAIKALRDLRLLDAFDPHNPYSLDCHPLVREYFGERLQKDFPEAWQAATAACMNTIKTWPRSSRTPWQTMAPLYAAVVHGCRAGRHQEALDEVYLRRICRGNELFSRKKLGAVAADLAALAAFFESALGDPGGFPHCCRSRPFCSIRPASGSGAWAGSRRPWMPLQAGLDRAVAQESWAQCRRERPKILRNCQCFGEIWSGLKPWPARPWTWLSAAATKQLILTLNALWLMSGTSRGTGPGGRGTLPPGRGPATGA